MTTAVAIFVHAEICVSLKVDYVNYDKNWSCLYNGSLMAYLIRRPSQLCGLFVWVKVQYGQCKPVFISKLTVQLNV